MVKILKFKNKFVLIIIAAVALYAILAILSDSEKLTSTVKNMKFELIPVILGSWTVATMIRAIRQHIILKNAGIDIGIKENIVIHVSGLMMMITPIGAGAAIKSEFIKNRFGHNRRQTLSLVLVERLLDFVTIISFLTISLFFFMSKTTLTLVIATGIFIALVIVMIRHDKLVIKLKSLFRNIKFLMKISEKFDEAHDSLRKMSAPKLLFKGWIISMISGIFDIITFYFVFQSLSINIDLIHSFQFVYSSILFGSLSFIPGGLGVTEGSLLSLLVNYGIQVPLATAGVLLIRFSTLWYSTILGYATSKFIKI